MRSRWALAASLALLLLGSLLLPGRFPADSKPENVLNAPGTASRILPDDHKGRRGDAIDKKNNPAFHDDGGDPLEIDDDMPLK